MYFIYLKICEEDDKKFNNYENQEELKNQKESLQKEEMSKEK
jgi:hypothetical protein